MITPLNKLKSTFELLLAFQFLCRILGAIFIMAGICLVLWGKNEEKSVENQEKEDSLVKHLLNAECIDKEDVTISDIA